MAKIRISTDSTSDIPRGLREELDITVLPLTIVAGDTQYRDGYDITPEEFYPIIDGAEVLPTSAAVTPYLYSELYEETWRAGYTDLIHVSLNSKGSASYQGAVSMRDAFYEEFPEAEGQLRIHLLDSLTYSLGYGWPVIEAARMAREGAAVEAILAHVEDAVAHARPMFVPLDLHCVKKSGRVSAAAAFVGEALGLKPLITFEDGIAKTAAKARGEARAIDMLVERCLNERKPGTPYPYLRYQSGSAGKTAGGLCGKTGSAAGIGKPGGLHHRFEYRAQYGGPDLPHITERKF